MSGKCEEKRRPFSKLAFNGYLSAEELCVLFHDIESQAASVWIRVSPVTRLGEPIENGVEIFPRNADPVIRYGDLHVFAVFADPCRQFDDAPFVREFGGIAHQVEQIVTQFAPV